MAKPTNTAKEQQKQDAKRSNTLFNIFTFWMGAGIVDYLCGVGIYLNYLLAYFIPALTLTAKLLSQLAYFPISATAAAIYAVLAWRTALLDKNKETGTFKNAHLARAIVTTISALLIVPAVIAGLVASATAGIATAAIYGANLGLTGIYNFTAAGVHRYLAYKKRHALQTAIANGEQQTIEKLEGEIKDHHSEAKSHLVVGCTTLLIAIAGGVVVLGGFVPVAGLGIAASLVGAAFFAYALAIAVIDKMKKKQPSNTPADDSQTPLLEKTKTRSTTPRIFKKIDATPHPNPTPRANSAPVTAVTAPIVVLPPAPARNTRPDTGEEIPTKRVSNGR